MRCFECGDIGHKRFSCPYKRAEEEAGMTGLLGESSGTIAVEKSLSGAGAQNEDKETKGEN